MDANGAKLTSWLKPDNGADAAAGDHPAIFPIMSGIWEDDLGFESSEPFLITDDGCEPFMDFPRDFLKY